MSRKENTVGIEMISQALKGKVLTNRQIAEVLNISPKDSRYQQMLDTITSNLGEQRKTEEIDRETFRYVGGQICTAYRKEPQDGLSSYVHYLKSDEETLINKGSLSN